MYKKTAVAAACVEIAENSASRGARCHCLTNCPVEYPARRRKTLAQLHRFKHPLRIPHAIHRRKEHSPAVFHV